jgi:hypothetical protein
MVMTLWINLWEITWITQDNFLLWISLGISGSKTPEQAVQTKGKVREPETSCEQSCAQPPYK